MFGVRGDESVAVEGEEPAIGGGTLGGGGGRLGRTEVAEELTVEASVTSDATVAALARCSRGGGCDGRINVRWLDARDILDLDSSFDVDLEIWDAEGWEEPLEPGRSSCSSSLTDTGVSARGVSARFFCAERSVSGGDGGLSSFGVPFRETDAFLEVFGESADLDLRISLAPRSVVSGVRGSVRRGGAEISSLL